MRTTGRIGSLLAATALGGMLVGAAAGPDEDSAITETLESSGLQVVSTTYDHFTTMAPGQTVSWYLDATSTHQPADLALRLVPSGEMSAMLSISDCDSADDCTELISDQEVNGEEGGGAESLTVEGFEETMNVRIDLTADEDLEPGEQMSLGAVITGADASVSVAAPGTGEDSLDNGVETPSTPVVDGTGDPASSDESDEPLALNGADEGGAVAGHDELEVATDASSGEDSVPQPGDPATEPAESAVTVNAAPAASSASGPTSGTPAADEGPFRGFLAATGSNALEIGLLALSMFVAGAAVLWRRNVLSRTG